LVLGFCRRENFADMVNVFLIGVASRIVVFFSAIVSSDMFAIRTALPNEGLWDLGLPFVNLFSRWDAGWYIKIAISGYPPGNNPVSQRWAWFPLYPATMRVVGQPLMLFYPPDQAVALAGFLISNIFFFVSLIIFYELSKNILASQKLALLSVLFFAFWPGSLFYSCVYSESLFMTFALGAFCLLEKEKQPKAVLLGFLAGLTRSNGFIVFIPFLHKGIEKRSVTLVLQSVIVASPYLLFNLYGYLATAAFPVREIVAQQYWEKPTFLFEQLSRCNLGYQTLLSTEIILILLPFIYLFTSKSLAISTFSCGLKETHKESKYFAFAIVQLVVLLFFTLVFNVHRYAIPMIPLYWVAAKTWSRNQILGIALFGLFTMLLSIGTILFATWRWFL